MQKSRSTPWFTAGLLLFMAALPLAVRADDAQRLLAEHKAFVGWQYGDGTFHYLRETGKITKDVNGKAETTSTFTVIRANSVYRATVTDDTTGLTTASGYTGNIFWQTNANGFIHPVIGDAERAQIAVELVSTEATTAFPGTVRGTANVDGTPVTIVRISPANAVPIDLYVDPSTGAYKRYIVDPDGAYRTVVDVLSYVDGPGGKKFIGATRHENSPYTSTITNVEAPAAIDLQSFAPPRPTASWSFDPTHAAIPISYDWYHTHRIYVHAKINGIEGKFILDTGAGVGIMLTQTFADRLHLKQINTDVMAGIGGQISARAARIDTLTIGGNTLSNLVVLYRDERLDADGVLGFDLLAGAIAHLDLDHQTLTLYDPATSNLGGLATNGLAFTIGMEDDIPMVAMRVDGRIPVRALLDTGNPMYVLFGRDLIYKDHLVMLRNDALLAGIGGYELVQCGAIDDIELGPIKYESAPACQTNSLSGHTIVVGLDFLRHFDFWFDYPDAQLVIVKRTTTE